MAEQKSEKELATELTIEFYRRRSEYARVIDESDMVKTWLKFYRMMMNIEDLPEEKE